MLKPKFQERIAVIPTLTIVIVLKISVFLLLILLDAGCYSASPFSPVGVWKSSGYPSVPPSKPYFLDIKANGTFVYSSGGGGTWNLSGTKITLRPSSGKSTDEFELVDGKPQLLRTSITDGISFVR